MAKPSTKDRRLVRLTKICLALPEEVTELVIGSYRMVATKGLAGQAGHK